MGILSPKWHKLTSIWRLLIVNIDAKLASCFSLVATFVNNS